MIKKLLVICCICLIIGCKPNETMNKKQLFVGTYTQNGSEGIYSYSFNTVTGALENKTLAAAVNNPSFLQISPNKKYLYAVEETNEYKNSSGGVIAFNIDNDTLIKINNNATLGAHPCHISISKDGKTVAASSYTGGSLTIFTTKNNGALTANPQRIDHTILDSTKTSHVHSATFMNNDLFVADLGLDEVKRYTRKENKFVVAKQASLPLVDKAGPRHFVFGQKGAFLYVINELNSSITVFKKNLEGSYNKVQSITTLDKDFKGESFCADIHISNDGNFLYGSNRGENTIVIFKIDAKNGSISLVGRTEVMGDWPRNFTLDPTEKFLLVANQKSNNITVFKRDTTIGSLTFLHETKLPSPVCLTFSE